MPGRFGDVGVYQHIGIHKELGSVSLVAIHVLVAQGEISRPGAHMNDGEAVE
jgi:hypothetical protein